MTPTFGNRSQIVLGVQRKGGHLSRRSLQVLRNWGVMYDPAIDEQRSECSWMTLPWRFGEPGTLLTCRLEDVLENMAVGALDLAIVSSDILKVWRTARREASARVKFSVVRDLGAAGSNLRLGVSERFLADRLGNISKDIDKGRAKAEGLWKDAVKACNDEARPIVTSNKAALEDFFMKKQLPFTSSLILERRGTIEAQGSIMRAPLVCDLVDSGDTMRANGYVPVESFEIAASRMLMVGVEPRKAASKPEDYYARERSYAGFLKAASTCSVPA